MAVTAFVTILGYFGHLTSDTTLTSLLAVATVTGGLTLYTLASSTPNAATVAHLIVAMGVAGGAPPRHEPDAARALLGKGG